MNWEKAKNTLIVFFIIIDACLFGILMRTNAGNTRVSRAAVQQTVKLLQQHQITVKESVIPRKKFKNRNYNLTALLFKNNKRTEKWIGSGYQTLQEDAAAHRYVYQNKNKQLVINKTGIDFSVSKNAVLLSEKSQKDMESYLVSKLKRMGFSNQNYYFSSVWYENGLYCARISPKAENIKLVGIELYVAADKDEIIKISGNWFQYSGKESFAENNLLEVTAVLANLIYIPGQEGSEITEISLAAYVSSEYLNNKVITAGPVYIFAKSDGTQYYFDARTGELIMQK